MSKTDIWMPLYIADYLADTTRLTAEQHGAYLLLIMDYWRNGPLPDDDAALANITRLSAPTWKKHRPTIARLFQVAQGEWRHKRIDEELHEAGANAKKNAERARKAAAVRWTKDSAKDAVSTPATNAESNAPSNARAMLDQCPSPSPSPEPCVTHTVLGASMRRERGTPGRAACLRSALDGQAVWENPSKFLRRRRRWA